MYLYIIPYPDLAAKLLNLYDEIYTKLICTLVKNEALFWKGLKIKPYLSNWNKIGFLMFYKESNGFYIFTMV